MINIIYENLFAFVMMNLCWCMCAAKHRLTEHFFSLNFQFQFQQSSFADKDLYSWNSNKCEKCLCCFNYFDVFRRHWHPNYKNIQDVKIEKRH